MSNYVKICSKLDSIGSKALHKLNVNNFEMDVKSLSDSVSKQFNINEEHFDLMCFGRVLIPQKSLQWYGIENGTTVFVLKKLNFDHLINKNNNNWVNENTIKVKPSQSEIQNMVIALRTALMDASFRQMLDKLSEEESRENLMAVTPGLREDPTIFAILQDPDLLTTLTEPANIHKVLERHPCLLEAATYLSATFHEETIANETSGGPSGPSLLGRGSSHFNYSLDAMSDDEDMSESDSLEQQQQQNSTSETAQHFANMLVRAFQSNQTSQSSATQSTSQGVITQDMLRQALQQSSQAPQPSTSSTSSTTSSTAARLRNWSTQLQQMRDLGINDDIVAIQALEATNGDVQAAVNLIFSDNN